MLSWQSDERVLYRVRKTVLEMLKDRGYQVADASIEESFEDFEKSFKNKPIQNIVAYRPYQSCAPTEDVAMTESEQRLEGIYTVFELEKDKITAEDMKKLLTFMHQFSENDKQANLQPLVKCIIVVKGGMTAIGRKVSRTVG